MLQRNGTIPMLRKIKSISRRCDLRTSCSWHFGHLTAIAGNLLNTLGPVNCVFHAPSTAYRVAPACNPQGRGTLPPRNQSRCNPRQILRVGYLSTGSPATGLRRWGGSKSHLEYSSLWHCYSGSAQCVPIGCIRRHNFAIKWNRSRYSSIGLFVRFLPP
jgi:hypothetical protein